KEILFKENYFNIINGYKQLFLKPNDDEKYLDGCTFDEIYALYKFDRALRKLFLDKILIVENNIKSVLSHYFASQYTENKYLKLSNLSRRDHDCIKDSTRFIASVHSDIADKAKRHSAISHYITNHGYVPPWVLVNILTFGRISMWISVLKDIDKENVARSFKINATQLGTFTKFLALARNICAHDERLYCSKFNIIADTKYHTSLNLLTNVHGDFIRGKRDCMALLITLKFFIGDSEYKNLVDAVWGELFTLKSSLKTINLNQVLSKMGFPKKWHKIRDL
uniref:Abi family protein n=1 Tax=Anaeromusa sp. TaxID=1872520 RepID=UPI00261A9C8E